VWTAFRELTEESGQNRLSIGMSFPAEVDYNKQNNGRQQAYAAQDRTSLTGVSTVFLSDERVKRLPAE